MTLPSDHPQDVSYPALFQREMAPGWIATVLGALGRTATDPQGDLAYCELGCGPGLTSAILAATHPRGRFTAVDASPRHMAQARTLVEAAGLRNLDLVEADFGSLGTDVPGAFDIIALHGVWSWISAAAQQAVLDFIRRALKPGGTVYLHAMTHPGLSAAASGQQLLRRHAAGAPGDSVARAEAGLALLEGLARAGAGVFVAHPEEAARLARARGQGGAYLAHEFLTPHWQPCHVAEMMTAMQGAGCTRAGSATPADNIDAVSLPAATLPLLRGITDPAVAETLRDLARNQAERRDLYQRDARPLDPAAHLAALHGQTLCALPDAPRGGGLVFDTRIGRVEGAAALFGPVLEALAHGPCRFADLLSWPVFAGQPGLLNQVFQMLIWSGCAHPVLPDPPDAGAAQRLNQHLARAARQAGRTTWLAAPAIGSALPATAFDIAGLLGPAEEDRCGPDEMLAWRRDRLPRWQKLGAMPTQPHT